MYSDAASAFPDVLEFQLGWDAVESNQFCRLSPSIRGLV